LVKYEAAKRKGPKLALLHSDINVLSIHAITLESSNLIYVRISIDVSNLLITNQVGALSQPFNDKVMTLSPAIDVFDIISSGLEVAGGVVALRDENVVVHTAFERLVEGNWWTLNFVNVWKG
jgi:hypothetical protein